MEDETIEDVKAAYALLFRDMAALRVKADALKDALLGLDKAYCRAGSPLSRDERHEDRKRLIAARAAIANYTGA